MDVFFQRKDAIIPVLCQIREVVNGFQQLNNYHLLVNMVTIHIWMVQFLSMQIRTTVTGTNTDFLTGKHNLRVGDTITIQGLGNQTSGIPNQE